jgi:hypothetical protein
LLAWAYHLSGRRAETVTIAERGMALAGDYPMGLADVRAIASEGTAARALLAGIERAAAVTYVPPIALARVYAILGGVPATLAWIGQASEKRDASMIDLAVDPTFAAVRREPAFIRLVTQFGRTRPA